jgi:hypothetical protein
MIERVAGNRQSVAAFLRAFATQVEAGTIRLDGHALEIGDDIEAWKEMTFEPPGLTARIRVQMSVRPAALGRADELERELSHPGD